MSSKVPSIQDNLNEIRALTMVLAAVTSGISARGEGNGNNCWPIDVDEVGERGWLELGLSTVYSEIDRRCDAIESIAAKARVLGDEGGTR